jgi:hypothetical protein
MSSATVPAPAKAEPLSQMQRIVNVFFAPSKTFTGLNRDPSWWTAWLLISVFGLLFIFAMQKQVGFDQIARNETAANAKATERMEKMTPEAREQALQMQGNITKYISFALPVTVLIFAAIAAGILLAVFDFGLGADVKFGTALAIVIYTWVVGILKSLLGAISLFAGADPEGFNINNPVATNLGFFISRGDHPVLHSALGWIDIFAIWYIILMGIGFAAVSKVKRGTAISAVAAVYIVVALIGTGLAAAFS